MLNGLARFVRHTLLGHRHHVQERRDAIERADRKRGEQTILSRHEAAA